MTRGCCTVRGSAHGRAATVALVAALVLPTVLTACSDDSGAAATSPTSPVAAATTDPATSGSATTGPAVTVGPPTSTAGLPSVAPPGSTEAGAPATSAPAAGTSVPSSVGGAGSTSTSAGTTTSTAPPSGTVLPGVGDRLGCGTATPAAVAGALGFPVTATEGGTTPDAAGGCSWVGTSGGEEQGVRLSTYAAGPGTTPDTVWTAALERYRQVFNASPATVVGLGDRAVSFASPDGRNGLVTVLVGGVVAQMQAEGPDVAAGQLRAVADLVVTGLR